MSEAEKKSFFAHTAARAPGKRQIKPTAAMLELEIPADDDEEDDEEFVAEKSSQDSDGSSSSSSEDDEDEEEGEGSDNEEDGVDREADDVGDSDGDRKTADGSLEKKPLICSICLNLRESVQKDEIMQCDKCGMAVHEMCYGSVFDPTDESASTHSSESTEPWFCEPCLFGLKEQPYCEFCPSRYGAFKRSDIGGRWVHPLCALFTPGATFGDVDHLTAISWQELDHKQFGRKACAACTEKLEARTGVTVRCEIGLCKEYFHVTCAQRLGLLVDHTDKIAEAVDEGTDKELTALSHYLTCKRHGNTEDTKVMRLAYGRWLQQEERRLLAARRKILSEREERKRNEQRVRLEKLFASLVGVTICWPNENFDKHDMKMRRARLLHTSPRYLSAFQEKAELVDVDKQQFQSSFLKVNVTNLSNLSPGFSQEFVEYLLHRETNVIPEEERRLEKLTKSVADLKEKKNSWESHGPVNRKQLEAQAAEAREDREDAVALLLRFYKVLQALGVKKIEKPSVIEGSERVTTPVVSPPRKKIKLGAKLEWPTTSKSTTTPKGSTKATAPERVIHCCEECKQTKDQHMLTHCDKCQKYYHIKCLDPPLERLPKRTANIGWICHNCDEEDEDEVEIEEEPSDGTSGRKLRQRSNILRTRKYVDQEEQISEYKEVVRRKGRPKSRNSVPRKSDEAPKKTTGRRSNNTNDSFRAASSMSVGSKTSSSGRRSTHSPQCENLPKLGKPMPDMPQLNGSADFGSGDNADDDDDDDGPPMLEPMEVGGEE